MEAGDTSVEQEKCKFIYKLKMGYKFEFKDGPTKKFSCDLKCQQCEAHNSNGERCKRTVCIGVPYCWTHLQKKEHLKIKNTENYGKGVFAWDPKKPAGAIVIRKGQKITRYSGEKIDVRTLDKRYGDKTAPYGLRRGKLVEDGACMRGTGTIFNHVEKGPSAALTNNNDHFFIKALKNIKNHDQIFVNYRTNPHKEDSYKFDEDITHTTQKAKSKSKRKNNKKI